MTTYKKTYKKNLAKKGSLEDNGGLTKRIPANFCQF